jgi:hypothetical protein
MPEFKFRLDRPAGHYGAIHEGTASLAIIERLDFICNFLERNDALALARLLTGEAYRVDGEETMLLRSGEDGLGEKPGTS